MNKFANYFPIPGPSARQIEVYDPKTRQFTAIDACFAADHSGQAPTMAVVRGELPAAIGLRVRKLRQEMQISQEELAERADLHRNYVGSVERGERDIGISALAHLARALGVSLAEFFQPFRQRPR